MYDSYKLFKKNLDKSSELVVLYDYSTRNLISLNFDDLLRAHLVYSVSAFDKFIHDVIRLGMLEIFLGRRSSTQKFLNESIRLETYMQLTSASSIPAEVCFGNEITRKLSFLSFQDTDKIADGLSYIWSENHKWQKIADEMSIAITSAKVTLKTIVARRNQIVHEADIDISNGHKYLIEKSDVIDACAFIELCGRAIYQNIKLPGQPNV